MRWGRDRWPDYVPRPKARRLTEKEKSKILAAMTRAVAASPVLSYRGVEVRALRGRFCIQRELREENEIGMCNETEADRYFTDDLRMDVERELLQQITDLAWYEATGKWPEPRRNFDDPEPDWD